MLSKPELRKQLRKLRAAVSPRERRAAAVLAAAHFAALPVSRRARRVALYLEYASELGTRPLLDWLWTHGVETYVPRLRAGAMHFVRMLPGTPLRAGAFGIPEPSGRLVRGSLRRMDIILLPLTGFDARGHRLGTGGGYYDRALAAPRPARKPLLIGYAYALQQVQAVPVEAWDVRLDAVVTEQGVMQWPIG